MIPLNDEKTGQYKLTETKVRLIKKTLEKPEKQKKRIIAKKFQYFSDSTKKNRARRKLVACELMVLIKTT